MGLRMYYQSAICLCSLAAVLGCCLGEVAAQITVGMEDLTKFGTGEAENSLLRPSHKLFCSYITVPTNAGLDVYGCICKGCRFSIAWHVQMGMH
ncbi:hypothetical protein BHM03_00001469 [Ensete ventricosum]|nr:hypothetical protein BHM03_00001469 [Ensete ventricosum]